MSKIRVSIDFGQVEIEDLTLADLAELYDELGDFFGQDDECECECEDEEEPCLSSMMEAIKRAGSPPHQTPPTTYPWDKPFPSGGWRHYSPPPNVTSPGWTSITPGTMVTFAVDAAGIPYYPDEYDG